MNQKMLRKDFAEVSDLEIFPELIKKITDHFETYQKFGWGNGLSGLHLDKMISRDPTIFTTTWAEIRQRYFSYMGMELRKRDYPSIEVPLPQHEDGTVLSDKEIREKVGEGYRLMYNPITTLEQIKDCGFIPFLNFDHMEPQDPRYEEVKQNLRNTNGKPYWFWINCEDDGSGTYSDKKVPLSPTLMEYLVAARVFEEETGRTLDDTQNPDVGYTWLKHYCPEEDMIVLGGKELVKVLKNESYGSVIVESYGEKSMTTDSKFPRKMRCVEVVK